VTDDLQDWLSPVAFSRLTQVSFAQNRYGHTALPRRREPDTGGISVSSDIIAQNMDQVRLSKDTHGAGRVAHVVECLSKKHEALRSNPSNTEEKERKKERKRERKTLMGSVLKR
jgi:hypothetical protein